MSIRITPLNITSSTLLVSAAYLVIFADREGWRLLGTIPLLSMAVISIVADLLFRRAIVNLKRIWIVESLFIIFVGVLMLLLGRWGKG